MRMYDLISQKRDGGCLDDRQIAFFVDGYTNGEIPDYQASALLMAICIRGMNERETAVLTQCMAQSGDQLDLSSLDGVKVDKHSTGGVGDNTTLIVGPLVAACGVSVAKMSGRGLGFTGGTLDKLEAIPGFQISIGQERFLKIVREVGLALVGQTGVLAPADKKLYALRDVTATVESLPLIASSIMSKKLAAGADAILLDVKTGSGAFMKTLEDAVSLAEAMVSIGTHNGRKVAALITDMDQPLGFAVGNALEVMEAADILKGAGPSDLRALCLQLAASMLELAGKGNIDTCMDLVRDALDSGRGFEKLEQMVVAQGGDACALRDYKLFRQPTHMLEICAPRDGWIVGMHTQSCGQASVLLGAGRMRKEDSIDSSAGIMLCKKTGEQVRVGEPLARLYTCVPEALDEAGELLLNAIRFGDAPPHPGKLVCARVTEQGVTWY